MRNRTCIFLFKLYLMSGISAVIMAFPALLSADTASSSSLFHTYILQYKNTFAKTHEAAAKITAGNIVKAIEHFAADHNGAYPGSEREIASSYYVESEGDYDKKIINGYVYSVALNPEGYAVRAQPLRCGITGTKTFRAERGKSLYEEPCEGEEQEKIAAAPAGTEEQPVPPESSQAIQEETPEEPLQGQSSYTSVVYRYHIEVPENWTIIPREDFKRFAKAFADSDAEILLVRKDGKGLCTLTAVHVGVPFDLRGAKDRLVEVLRVSSVEVDENKLDFSYGDGGFELGWLESVEGVTLKNLILFAVYDNEGIQCWLRALASDSEEVFNEFRGILKNLRMENVPQEESLKTGNE